MTPLTVITLIVLGTAFAITFSLAAVIVMVLILGDEYPRLQGEFDPLLESFFLFAVMTAISAASFYALLKTHPSRYWAQAAMWLTLALIGRQFWV